MAEYYGEWITIRVLAAGTTSPEADLGGEFRDVQVYNPALDNATITLRPARVKGGTEVQAYSFNEGATGDFANATSARTTAGMNVFRDVCARYLKVHLGAAQAGGNRDFLIRGIGLMQPRITS